jgi:hypothetical protein
VLPGHQCVWITSIYDLSKVQKQLLASPGVLKRQNGVWVTGGSVTFLRTGRGESSFFLSPSTDTLRTLCPGW